MAQSNANWRDELATDDEAQNGTDRPILKIGSLTTADTATIRFLSDGEMVETEFENDDGETETVRQLRVPVVLEEVDGRVMTGDQIPAETDNEYVVLSAARSFINPLSGIPDLEGETVEVTSAGSGQYDGYEVKI
jgi:hypothetical protein